MKRDFTNVNVSGLDLRDIDITKTIFDPQKVKDKNIKACNLEGLDLSKYDFTGVDIVGANLKDTGAVINPQKIKDKDLSFSCLEAVLFFISKHNKLSF